MKVKVKRVRGGSMGDQRNYGLVTGSIWNHKDKRTSNAVGDTIQESPRDKANIEAERGETVVGDIDSDGMLEHLKIGGKRHHSGGTPLNVPDGSFVFSDTSALRIKNKDLLKNIFGMNSSKSGVTPAQVARRYQLNDYKELLNDPWADPFEKRTAQMMMDNNLKKLGQLALIQESMKGFPDGIPNIALPLFASDMGQQQMMRKGGLVKAQGGKNVKKSREQTILDYHPAANNPLNYDPDMIYERDPSYDFARGFFGVLRNPVSAGAYFIDPNARTQSWGSYVNKPPTMLDLPFNFTPFGSRLAAIGSIPYLAQYENAGETKEEESGWRGALAGLKGAVGLGALVPLTYGLHKGLQYVKSLPFYERSVPAVKEVVPMINRKTGKPYQKGLINPKTGEPYVRGPKAGRSVILEVEEARQAGLKPTVKEAISKLKNIKMPGGKWGWATLGASALGAGAAYLYDKYLQQGEQDRIVDPNLDAAAAAGDSIPALNYSTSPDTTDYRSIMFTGNQGTATPTTPPAAAPTATQRTTPAVQQRVQTKPVEQREYRKLTPEELDSLRSYKIGGSNVPVYQNAGQKPDEFTAYRPESRVRSSDEWEIIPSAQDIDFTFGVQSYDPVTGTYGAVDPATGKRVPVDLEDWFNRAIITEQETGFPYLSAYPGGVDQFKKDVLSPDPATREKAVGYEQTAYDALRAKINMPEYYYGTPGKDPYGEDKLLGYYTFMRPGFRKKKKPKGQGPLAQPKTETKKPDDIQVKRQEYAPGLAMRPEIWNFDKVNMANAMLNRAMIERGADPTLYRYNPYVAEAVYMDPSYDIAAQQGALATATQALGATAPTQQAMANILQAQAQTAEPIAQITSQTNKANIALANQMAQQQAQAYNQAQLQNIQFQKRWEDEKEVLRQQYQNALAEGNTELAKSIMQAMKNAATTAWVNATQDQYAVDPATGSVYFKGGKDPRLFGATESDYATMGAGIDAFASAAGISREKAAELYLKYIAGKGSSKKSKVNPLTGEEARYGGKYKFGGEVFNPIDDIWN